MIDMKRPFVLGIAVIALLSVMVFARVEEEAVLPAGTTQDSLHIKGYDVTFLRPEKFHVNKDLQLAIEILDSEGKRAEGMDVQGQILDPEFGKEIFYAAVSEIAPARYAFTWKPSFAGDYFVQFVFRSVEDEILQPSFAVRVDDSRGRYAFIAGIIVAVLILAVGLYASLPWKGRKFRIKPLLTGIVLGVVFFGLGYSVSYFYQKGGERGFVICGPEGCELAAHWHSQLEMNVCGKPYHLPLELGDLNKQHTHKERDKLHFHATIKTDKTGTQLLEPEKLKVGELFAQLNIRFTKDCFTDYCNGDACADGLPGTLRMMVNGVPNDQYADYVWKDGDKMSITFGP